MKKEIISVVVPVYKGEPFLAELCRRVAETITELHVKHEIVLVNDASPDDSWKIIQGLAARDRRIKGINLSRNFGQHAAVTAGLEFAQGDWIVVMDCDLQDVPEEIAPLYARAREGYDAVVGRRANRKDGFIKKLTSRLFYVVFNYLTGQKLDNRVANFGIYSRRVVTNILRYKEADRSFGLLAVLVGFSRCEIDVEHAERTEGKSAYTFRKRLNMALDHILSHSSRPLKMSIHLGMTISLLSAIFSVWLVIKFLVMKTAVSGWTSIMVALFFLSGLIIAVIGMVGLYVGKIFNEVKDRPLYIVSEKTFMKK